MTTAISLVAPQPKLPPCQRCEQAREHVRISGRGYQNMNALNQAKYKIDGELLCARHAQIKALGILLAQMQAAE